MSLNGLAFMYLDPIADTIEIHAKQLGIDIEISANLDHKMPQLDLYFNNQEDLNLFRICSPVEKYKDEIYFNFLVYES